MLKDELEAIILSDGIWSARSTFILAVGILGEYAVLPFFEDKHGRRKVVSRLVFAVCVVAGIAGEYGFSRRITLNAARLQGISDGELAGATDRATTAESSGHQLGIALEKEKQKTARFQREADTARLAFERTLALMSARYKLVNLGKAQILKATSSFGGQKVEIQTCQGLRGDSEINLLSQAILELLTASKWETHSAVWTTCVGGFGRSGVTVSVNDGSSNLTMAAGESLAMVLEKLLWGDFNEQDLKLRALARSVNGKWGWIMPVSPRDPPLAAETVRVLILGRQPQ